MRRGLPAPSGSLRPRRAPCPPPSGRWCHPPRAAWTPRCSPPFPTTPSPPAATPRAWWWCPRRDRGRVVRPGLRRRLVGGQLVGGQELRQRPDRHRHPGRADPQRRRAHDHRVPRGPARPGVDHPPRGAADGVGARLGRGTTTPRPWRVRRDPHGGSSSGDQLAFAAAPPLVRARHALELLERRRHAAVRRHRAGHRHAGRRVRPTRAVRAHRDVEGGVVAGRGRPHPHVLLPRHHQPRLRPVRPALPPWRALGQHPGRAVVVGGRLGHGHRGVRRDLRQQVVARRRRTPDPTPSRRSATTASTST